MNPKGHQPVHRPGIRGLEVIDLLSVVTIVGVNGQVMRLLLDHQERLLARQGLLRVEEAGETPRPAGLRLPVMRDIVNIREGTAHPV